MSPTPLRATALAVLLALASGAVPSRAEPAPAGSATPAFRAATPELALMLAEFEKARRETAIPLAPAAATEAPAEPKPGSRKKTWIIVGVVLGVVAIVALAGGGGGGGGGGGY
ncbi:MAG TPA: hypothetical protein VF139_11520 [Candidatus Polarisedimenticolaceae bacterium]